MNEITRQVLNFDPFAPIKDILDNPQSDSNTKMLYLNLMHNANKTKAEYLKEIGDTYYGISWADFLRIVKDYGFKIGYCQKYTNSWSSKGTEEENIIFFLEEKGLILHASSYEGNLNTAKIYGGVKVGDKVEKQQIKALEWCSCGHNGNGTMHFDVDVREGFRYHLDALLEAFEFSKSWTKVQHLNLDLSNEQIYINRNMINQSCPEVRKIIFG